MKMATANQEVAVHGNFQTSDFAIGDISFIVDMFADKVYSHKERAVIRELSCNAHDSHVMAGTTDVPFVVHLPTALEGWFSIRDYGTGLSDEDVRNIFAGIGISTKRDSNEVIGCFGIGSLSPYALGDSFTVKSYMNGVVRHYNCYRDEDRRPVVALLTEMETGERNGLEVSLTVNGKTSAFREEAVNVFKYWEGTTPDINDDYVLETVKENNEFLLQGDGFGLNKSWGDLYAVMGNIAYRIDSSIALDNRSTVGDNWGYVSGFIKFDLGDLEFDTARENLADTPQTRASINAKLREVEGKLRSIAVEQIEAETTAFRKACRADQLSGSRLGRMIGDLSMYDLDISDTPITYWNRTYNSTTKAETKSLPLGKKVKYYRHKDRMQTRIRSWMKDHTDTTMVILTDDQLHLVEGETVLDLDVLPKVHRLGTSSGGCKLKTYTFDPDVYRHSKNKTYWDAATLELDGEEIVYVEIQRWEPISYGNRELVRKIKSLQKQGIDVQVVGLKSVFMRGKAFQNGLQSGQFISLEDFAHRELDKIKPKSMQVFDKSKGDFLISMNDKIQSDELKCFEVADSNSELIRTCISFGVDIEKDNTIQKKIDDFFNKYPMLDIVEEHLYIPSMRRTKLQRIADYIGGTVE